MALSYYSNWGPQVLDQQHLKQEDHATAASTNNNIFFPQEQLLLSQDLLLPPELLNFHDNFDTCIDTLFTQNNHFFYSDECVNALPPAPVHLNILPSSEMVEEEDACYPKRTKIQQDYFFYPEMTIHDNYGNNNNYDDMGFVPNPPLLLPELPMPPVFNDNEVKKAANAGGKLLSQQSIAARIRRRKITEKTQELGKLIPGGQKMNTADMFQAASKYIKFMQAQIGILQLMQQQQEGMLQSPEVLEALVTSPLVQEKLYSAEKCLVPKLLVQNLIQKPQLHSNPHLIKDLVKLI